MPRYVRIVIIFLCALLVIAFISSVANGDIKPRAVAATTSTFRTVVATTTLPPTTTTTHRKLTKNPPKPPVSAPPTAAPSGDFRSRVLTCIRSHEGGGYATVSASGKYRGAYQADSDFYSSYAEHPLGPDGKWLYATADKAPASIQDDMAWRGFLARKYGPWPPSQGKCPYA